MKFGCLDNNTVGAIHGDRFYDLSTLLGAGAKSWPPTAMINLIARYDALGDQIAKVIKEGQGVPLSAVHLDCPISWPNKIIAFPANYEAHISEMKDGLISTFKADGQGFFLKANSSLSGPCDPIVLPNVFGRAVHHECELAVIIGQTGRNIPQADAMDYVFGYSCLLDMVVRGKEERVMRKSFDSFCPLGPYLVTADEVPRYDDIELELFVDGEMRQSANTRDLIVGIPAMIEMASSVMTLYPGDIIASGTPAGVGPVQAGNVIDIRIKGIGEMTIDVVAGAGEGHPLWRKTAG